jgi:hypothetical protein
MGQGYGIGWVVIKLLRRYLFSLCLYQVPQLVKRLSHAWCDIWRSDIGGADCALDK